MDAERGRGTAGRKRRYLCEEVFAKLGSPVGFTGGRVAGQYYELHRGYSVSITGKALSEKL